ncbi:hypothetical protein E2C01_030358 [Portunus trituberculatus]|uniref:Uncharacterized protein n=1 Tax=Portunus trituberculatus TaxID=210409 RepID=A0A5B7EV45_PORTR|nr:hypothetical protein [Portunus trituberculatus]
MAYGTRHAECVPLVRCTVDIWPGDGRGQGAWEECLLMRDCGRRSNFKLINRVNCCRDGAAGTAGGHPNTPSTLRYRGGAGVWCVGLRGVLCNVMSLW